MSVRKSALWAMLGQYASFAISFAMSVIISRFFLKPSEVGLFSLAFSSATLVSLLQDFGINRYLIASNRIDSELLRIGFSISSVMGLVIAAVIVLTAGPAAAFYQEPGLKPILTIIGATYVLLPFSTVPIALLQKDMRFREVAVINLLSSLANAVVSISLAAKGWSALSLGWGFAAQQVTRCVLIQLFSSVRPPIRPQFRGAAGMLGWGAQTTLLSVSDAISTRTPELMLGRLLNMTAVGLYGRAAGLADQLRMMVNGALSSVFYAALAKRRNEGEELTKFYERVVACYTATTWPAMGYLALSAQPIVLGLYGGRWIGVAPLLSLVALSEMLFIALPLHADIAILFGKLRPLIARDLIGTLFAVITTYIGASLNLESAAWARIGYAAIWYVIYVGFIRALIHFSWRAMWLAYLQGAVATIATLVPLAALYALVGRDAVGLAGVIGCAVAGSLCWLGVIFSVRHPLREEIGDQLGPLLKRIGFR